MLNKFKEDEKELLNNYIQQLIEIGIMYLNKENYDYQRRTRHRD